MFLFVILLPSSFYIKTEYIEYDVGDKEIENNKVGHVKIILSEYVVREVEK